MLKQRDFVKATGDRSVIWIDPQKITHHVRSKRLVASRHLNQLYNWLPRAVVGPFRPMIKKREPFVIPSRYFDTPMAIKDSLLRQKMGDFVAHHEDVRTSIWYHELSADLQRDGVARHKKIEMRSDSDVLEFMENYAAAMVRSLKKDGFLASKSSYESSAVIGPDGGLYKAGSGKHRFYICQALGTPSFPVVVVAAHEDWVARVLGEISVEGVIEALVGVEAAHR